MHYLSLNVILQRRQTNAAQYCKFWLFTHGCKVVNAVFFEILILIILSKQAMEYHQHSLLAGAHFVSTTQPMVDGVVYGFVRWISSPIINNLVLDLVFLKG
ncbi:hypothetical protein ACJX0J_035801, partial [Zea mays]